MSLLDLFLKGTGDPQKDAAINRGLLTAGLSLMQARGRLFPALGQAGMAGLQAGDQTMQQAQQRQRAELHERAIRQQIEAQQRQAETDQLGMQFYRPPSAPAVDATGGMETAVEAPNNASGPGGFDMPGYIQALYARSPVQAMQLQQAMGPKPADYKVVGSSLVRVGPQGVEEAYRAPDKPETAPSAIREYEFARSQGYRGTFDQWDRERRRAGATSVSVNTKQEGEEAKVVGKFFGEQYGDILKGGFSANRTLNRLNDFERLLGDVGTGKLTPLGKEIASYARSLGINLDPNLGNKEAIEAVSNEMALEMRNPAGGAGMPGAMSDADRQFLQNIVPNLQKTPEGNRMIIEARRRLARREQDIAKLARDYRASKGSLDEGFYEELDKRFGSVPLFSDLVRKASGSAGGSSSDLIRSADEIVRRSRGGQR